jgi:predicted RNase H-like HicB family nuclease
MTHFTVSTAKPKLGRLLDSVLKTGAAVVIRRGGRFVQLSECVVPDPIPERASGAFLAEESPSPYVRSSRLQFRINLFESDEGWAASCPDLAGCHSQGKSRAEALKNIREAVRLWLEVEKEETGLKRVEQADVLV